MTRNVTLVTGASAGIGRALADVFAEHGHDLVLVARSAGKLKTAAAEIAGRTGAMCDWIAADLSLADDCDRVLAELDARGFHVDVLVNNAGVLHEGHFLDVSADRHVQLVDLNVLSVIRLTHVLAGRMRDRRAGRILNVASTSSFNPVPSLACYAASKAFLLSFSESLSLELEGEGVTVTALCPGFTNTDMIAQGGRAPMRLPVIPNLEPREVAESGYAACMKGDPVRIPGLFNRLAVTGLRHTPDWVRRRTIALVERIGV